MIDSKLTLSKHGISKTKFRVDLLNLFYKSQKSFSVEGIVKYFSSTINKVTIYRALDDFETKGLIHKVPDNNGLKKYALCRHNKCNALSHNHNHGHFLCFTCNQTFCIDELILPEFTSLNGFHIQELKVIAEGYCQDCYQI